MSIEARRGCGFRKVGGLYLVADKEGFEPCHRLPFVLAVCPTCAAGIKQARGWTWIDPVALFKAACTETSAAWGGASAHCPRCAVCTPSFFGRKKAGLLWVGEAFYKSPADFMAEGFTLGVSRRIHRIPREFKVGETWVLLAHSKALNDFKTENTFAPGIFAAFEPQRIEKLITQSEATPETLDELKGHGITPVVVPDDDPDHRGTVYDERAPRQLAAPLFDPAEYPAGDQETNR